MIKAMPTWNASERVIGIERMVGSNSRSRRIRPGIRKRSSGSSGSVTECGIGGGSDHDGSAGQTAQAVLFMLALCLRRAFQARHIPLAVRAPELRAALLALLRPVTMGRAFEARVAVGAIALQPPLAVVPAFEGRGAVDARALPLAVFAF